MTMLLGSISICAGNNCDNLPGPEVHCPAHTLFTPKLRCCAESSLLKCFTPRSAGGRTQPTRNDRWGHELQVSSIGSMFVTGNIFALMKKSFFVFCLFCVFSTFHHFSLFFSWHFVLTMAQIACGELGEL